MSTNILCSQDVIIKKDQTEIKSKIIEIAESTIKYKKWESLDGPTYNISKREVFLILYENGIKEYYNKEPNVNTNNNQNNSVYSAIANTSTSSNNNTQASDNSNQAIYYSDISRVNIGFSGAGTGYDVYSLGLGYSGMLSPYSNNSAVEYDFLVAFSGGDFVDSTIFLTSFALGVGYGVYFDKSFKISAGAGYGYSFGSITSDNSSDDDELAFGGFYYYSNFDYFLSDSFGINMRYDYILGLSFGIQWKS